MKIRNFDQRVIRKCVIYDKVTFLLPEIIGIRRVRVSTYNTILRYTSKGLMAMIYVCMILFYFRQRFKRFRKYCAKLNTKKKETNILCESVYALIRSKHYVIPTHYESLHHDSAILIPFLKWVTLGRN